MNVLFNTKLRRKILTYAFTHPTEDFYVRELAVFISEDPGNISRELRKLSDEGLFDSKVRGRAKYYKLEPSYPLYHELKRIVSKTEEVEGSLKRLIEEFPSVSLAFIYGSYAKGGESKSSDIDLVLVGRCNTNVFTRKVRKIEQALNREVNFAIYTKTEFEKERQVEGAFLAQVLKGKVILLKGKMG